MEVKSDKVKPTESVAMKLTPAKTVASFEDSCPSNWEITAGEGDLIDARNRKSGETFSGSVADFNIALRG